MPVIKIVSSQSADPQKLMQFAVITVWRGSYPWSLLLDCPWCYRNRLERSWQTHLVSSEKVGKSASHLNHCWAYVVDFGWLSCWWLLCGESYFEHCVPHRESSNSVQDGNWNMEHKVYLTALHSWTEGLF